MNLEKQSESQIEKEISAQQEATVVADKKLEEEKEDQDQLVLIQFTDIDDANYCQHFSHKFKSLEIQSNSPVIQIGSRFYSGEYTNNIGTYLFFESDLDQKKSTDKTASTLQSNTKNSDVLPATSIGESSDLKYKYSGKSFKRLVLSRLFIEENSDNKAAL